MNLDPSKFYYIGILFYSYNEKGELVFLLGRERADPNFKDQLKWSEFGGKPEKTDNNIYESAAREAYEESMGFFDNKEELLQRLLKSNQAYINGGSAIFTLEIEYNPKLIKLYKNVYKYIKNATYKHKIGYLEKIEIRYFTISEIVNNKDIMRSAFYKSFCENIIRPF